MRYLLIFAVILSGCGGEKEGPSAEQSTAEHLGSWKSDCIGSAQAPYWVTSEYTFETETFVQSSYLYSDEKCTLPYQGLSDPAISHGNYSFAHPVDTKSGVQASWYNGFFFAPASEAEGFSMDFGIYIEGDVLYLVTQDAEDFYQIMFEIPFVKN